MDEPKLAPSAQPDRAWNLAQRLGFRVAFGFWFLLIFPWPLDSIPKSEPIWKPIGDGFEKLTLWTAKHVFGIAGPIGTAPNGSGDRTIDWVGLFVTVALALVAATIWSLLDLRRRDHRRLHALLRLWMRYWLASAFYVYGLIKVFCLQMPYMLTRAIEPYGQSSPMGLLWTFLGQSPPYEVFAGCCEVLAGTLLLFRRTTALGALVGIGVMGNVFVMNMCYDVPVKIYSFELVLTAAFLALPSLGSLLKVLVLRQAVAADPPPRRSRRRTIVFAAVQVLFTAWFGYQATRSVAMDRFGKKPSITGIYDVRGPQPRRFARFAIEAMFSGALTTDGKFSRFLAEVDEKTHAIKLTGRGDAGNGLLFWTPGANGALTLAGTLKGEPVTMNLAPADMSKELLYTRGFHWVNEIPFNR